MWGILYKLLQVLHKFRGQVHENMLINMNQTHRVLVLKLNYVISINISLFGSRQPAEFEEH